MVTVRVSTRPSAVPSTATCTVDWPFSVATAAAGTSRTPVRLATVISAITVVPT